MRLLDPVYTGKTCAALLDFIKDPGHANDTILYWHTYNSIDHSQEAQELDYHDLPTEFHEFFQGFVNHALVTLHIDNLEGRNSHHIAETVFKAFGRALRMAVEPDARMGSTIPSTKGSL